jgi:hypothetical protein
MDTRREHVPVLFLVFMVIKYVIMGILALQKFVIFQQNVQMIMMAVFIIQRRRVDFGRSCWRFQIYRRYLEQTFIRIFPEKGFKRGLTVNKYTFKYLCILLEPILKEKIHISERVLVFNVELR